MVRKTILNGWKLNMTTRSSSTTAGKRSHWNGQPFKQASDNRLHWRPVTTVTRYAGTAQTLINTPAAHMVCMNQFITEHNYYAKYSSCLQFHYDGL